MLEQNPSYASVTERDAREAASAGAISSALTEILGERTMRGRDSFIQLVSGVAHYNQAIMPDVKSEEPLLALQLGNGEFIDRETLIALVEQQLAIEAAQAELVQDVMALTQRQP